MENLNMLSEFFATNKTQSYSFRIQKLKQLQQSLLKFEGELLDALRLDLNKPMIESYAGEVAILHNEIKHISKHLKCWMKPKKVSNPLSLFYSRSCIYHVPLGVVLVISPWNYPVQLALLPLIGAIAAGNCVVLKPSEFTPNVNQILNSIITEVFTNNHVLQIEGYGVSLIPELINSKIFNHVFFTGSTKVGRVVAGLCANLLIPYTLELGGKSPTIVDSSANLKTTAKRIVWAKFYNAGQTCVAPDYILVHNTVKEQLVSYLKQYIDEFYSNTPQDLAKIINQTRFNILCAYLEGATILHGGKYNADLLSFEPTIIDLPGLDHPLMKDEIFGPILPILSYNDVEELKTIISKNPNPLSLYIFSENKKLVTKVINDIQFGGGGVNIALMHVANGNMPFGGVMSSGNGSYHGINSCTIMVT